MINTDNWNYCSFTLDGKRTFISLLGEEFDDDVAIFYAVTTTAGDGSTIAQTSYAKVEDAVEFVNKKCLKWEFIDPTAQKESGCSTCVAH